MGWYIYRHLPLINILPFLKPYIYVSITVNHSHGSDIGEKKNQIIFPKILPDLVFSRWSRKSLINGSRTVCFKKTKSACFFFWLNLQFNKSCIENVYVEFKKTFPNERFQKRHPHDWSKLPWGPLGDKIAGCLAGVGVA